MMASMGGHLTDIRHLVILTGERVSATDRPELADRATECRAYHLAPAGEDRIASRPPPNKRSWPPRRR